MLNVIPSTVIYFAMIYNKVINQNILIQTIKAPLQKHTSVYKACKSKHFKTCCP